MQEDLCGEKGRINHNQPVDSYRFALEIVQQPIRSRLCGFGEKDRRPIDPPPVVQARAYEMLKDGSEVELADE